VRVDLISCSTGEKCDRIGLVGWHINKKKFKKSTQNEYKIPRGMVFTKQNQIGAIICVFNSIFKKILADKYALQEYKYFVQSF